MDTTALISMIDDPRCGYETKGFCSIVVGIIDIVTVHYDLYKNFNIFIDDDNVLDIFYQKGSVTEDYYDAVPPYIDEYIQGKFEHLPNANRVADLKNILKKRRIMDEVISLKKYYVDEFEQKKREFGITDNTLGIHLRGTDKSWETPRPLLVDIFKTVDQELDSHDKIFLSTDELFLLNVMSSRYGKDLIIYDEEAKISDGNAPVHKSNLHIRKQINREIMQSVYMLSKCKTLAYSFSNVSHLALIMGADSISKAVSINTGIGIDIG